MNRSRELTGPWRCRAGIALLLVAGVGLGGACPGPRDAARRRTAAAGGPDDPGPDGADRAGDDPSPRTPSQLVEVRRPNGRIDLHWVEPGEVIVVSTALPGQPGIRFALPYAGERRLRWQDQPHTIRVNGRVRVARLAGLTPAAAVALIKRHRATLVGVTDGPDRVLLTRRVLAALRHVRARRVVVLLERYANDGRSLGMLRQIGRRLHGLVLSAGRITDGDLKPLRRVRALRALHLLETPVGDPGLRSLAAMRRLRYLHLGWARISDAGMATLARLRGLRSLRLQADRVTAAGFARLAALRQLRHLDVSRTGLDDQGLSAIIRLPRLRALRLRKTHISDAGLAELPRLTHLRHLDLEWTRITVAGLRHVAQLHGLVSLNLNTTKLTDDGLAQVARLTHLVHLNLGGSLTTRAGLAALQHLTHLRYLYLGPTNTDDAGLLHLGHLTQLRVLDLRGALITTRGMAHLKGLSHLRWLHLSETGIKPEVVAAFRRAHPGCVVTQQKRAPVE